jgi:hypothetical protein
MSDDSLNKSLYASVVNPLGNSTTPLETISFAVKEDEIKTQKGMKHAIIIITSGIKTTSIPKVAPIFCFVIFSI